MRNLKTTVASAVLAFCAAGSQAAALSSQDLFAAGDGLLTLDSSTQMQWLDVSSTLGYSVDQIRTGAGGWTDLGFRYASFSEFKGLLYSAGLSEPFPGSYVAPTNGYMNGTFAEGASLFGLMGGPTSQGRLSGFLQPIPCSGGDQCDRSWDPENGGYTGPDSITYLLRLNLIADTLNPAYGVVTSDPSGPSPISMASMTIGSYLVRPVPEPETYALMLTGLGIVGWTVRRKKTKAAAMP